MVDDGCGEGDGGSCGLGDIEKGERIGILL